MLHFMRQSQVLRTCPVAEIERCHWTLAHFDVHGLLIPASQILTAHLYELKKTLHWHPNSWSACGSSVQLPKPPPPALQQMEVLDCLRWSTGEPIQKKLREISNSCWDPCRFEMHLWGLILICLIYISVYLLQSDKNSVRSNTVAKVFLKVSGAQILCLGLQYEQSSFLSLTGCGVSCLAAAEKAARLQSHEEVVRRWEEVGRTGEEAPESPSTAPMNTSKALWFEFSIFPHELNKDTV